MMARWLYGWMLALLLVVGSSGAALGTPATHRLPDVQRKMQVSMGDAMGAFVVSGCAPTVPSSSLTFGAFACESYVRDTTTGELLYASQDAVTLTLANTNGTHWLAVCRDTTSTVSGWTRRSGSHYVHRQVTAYPGNPTGCLVFAQVTVAANVISAVQAHGRWNPLRTDVLSIEDPAFGLNPDPTVSAATAVQAVLDKARGKCVYFPERLYVIDTALAHTTSGNQKGVCWQGAGMGRTIFDNRVASNAMLTINGAGTAAAFQMGFRLEGFSITTTTSPASSHGISLKGTWLGTIEQVCIGALLCAPGIGNGLTGDGIRFVTDLGDGDAASNVRLVNVHIEANDGIGVNYVSATGVLNLGYIEIVNSLITRNTGGGIRWHALEGRIANTGIVQNGNTTDGIGGLYVYYDGAGTRTLIVEQCQFDSNAGGTGYDAHITVDSIISLRIISNEFRFNNVTPPGSFGPSFGIIMGDGVNAVNGVTIEGNNIVSVPTNPSSATVFYTEAANVDDVRLINNQFLSFSGGNATRHDFAGNNTVLLDDNRWTGAFLSTVLTSTAGGGTYGVSVDEGTYHRITVTSGSTIEIGQPTGAQPGRELLFDIANGTGSAISVTWHAVYRNVRTYRIPASDRLMVRVIFDATGGNWVAQGRPSSDAWTFYGTNNGPGIGSIAAGVIATFDTTVTGAVAGCVASANPRSGIGTACAGSTQCFVWSAYVTTTDTVRTLVHNVDAGSARTPTDVAWDMAVHCP